MLKIILFVGILTVLLLAGCKEIIENQPIGMKEPEPLEVTPPDGTPCEINKSGEAISSGSNKQKDWLFKGEYEYLWKVSDYSHGRYGIYNSMYFVEPTSLYEQWSCPRQTVSWDGDVKMVEEYPRTCTRQLNISEYINVTPLMFGGQCMWGYIGLKHSEYQAVLEWDYW